MDMHCNARSDGMVEVIFTLRTADDDGPRLHRSLIDPDQDIDAFMALVSADLSSMGEQPVSEDDMARIRDAAAEARTPGAVAAYHAKIEMLNRRMFGGDPL